MTLIPRPRLDPATEQRHEEHRRRLYAAAEVIAADTAELIAAIPRDAANVDAQRRAIEVLVADIEGIRLQFPSASG